MLETTDDGTHGRVIVQAGSTPRPIVVVGVPFALGGGLSGRERAVAGMTTAPADLRARGLLDKVGLELGAGSVLEDAGDIAIDPAMREDSDRRAKNRDLIAEELPRIRDRLADALDGAGPDARLFLVGGDCTVHAAALAALRRLRPGARIALAWFDAHGDFNTPDTTPSGDVWGMPFAMACGRGDRDLLAACDAPTVREEDCALLGGQMLDEEEARRLAASRIAHLGSGMLSTEPGLAALKAWAAVVARSVDGFYIAVDHDCLDAAGGWAVTMPEPDGLSLETAVAAIGVLAEAAPVLGYGATTISLPSGDAARTVDAAAALAVAAFGGRP
jgi:arginase